MDHCVCKEHFLDKFEYVWFEAGLTDIFSASWLSTGVRLVQQGQLKYGQLKVYPIVWPLSK